MNMVQKLRAILYTKVLRVRRITVRIRNFILVEMLVTSCARSIEVEATVRKIVLIRERHPQLR